MQRSLPLQPGAFKILMTAKSVRLAAATIMTMDPER
jgi:hypothetical protein